MSSRKGTSGGTCEYCGNSYSKREHYQRHVRTHTRERPYSCDLCSATFSRKDTLHRHARARHPEAGSPSQGVDEQGGHSRQESMQSLQDGLQTPPQTDHAFDHAMSSNADFASMQFSLNSSIDPCSTMFDWPWDDSMNLDPSFSLESLGTYDLNTASPSIPWLPLRSEAERPYENMQQDTLRPPPNISQSWFSSMSNKSKYPTQPWASPNVSDTTGTTGDEISRDVLADSLQQRVPDTTLPPTQFLNRCLHMFTTRLWPLIPIVHLPTFEPARTNPLLLLSICSLGALAIGSEEALYHGERLFDGVQKAILVSFAPNRIADEHSLAILQAAMIGQTYALLSGSAANLLTAQCFHGTMGVSIRTFYDQWANPKDSSMVLNEQSSPSDWEPWIREQTAIRLLNCIHVHNGEVFATVHQPALLRAHPFNVRLAADDKLFLSKTADEWVSMRARYARHQPEPHSLFSTCASLDCFVAEIYHRKTGPFNRTNVAADDEIYTSLITWFNESAQLIESDGAKRLSLLMLWHSCFVLLLSDLDLVERVCGRDGSNISQEDTTMLHAWITTPQAKQCVVHALLIYILLERFRVSEVPAIHVARVAWQAGLVLATYSFFARTEPNINITEAISSCPALKAARRTPLFTQSDWATVDQSATPERCRTTAFSLSATLRHLGPWQNGVRYAKTLDQILHLFEPY
ncbi:hypothetical protein PRZ48_011567 [Zasmidium cellare]|uniref:C2H2-type domain-containing protein n=1 Tax=Zasmidium cellare TaxID=395010 RepID=A0ABR0E6Q1_ZASCE|nr:hypothetical protein PRZ48_011567 [Zasmidium cellare]